MAARARISLTYFWQHGRLPKLDAPRRLTELIQWRKLNDRDARMPVLADKVRAKHYVADALGHAWVIPTLWEGPRLPSSFDCPEPFVIKSRHGCNQTLFVRGGATDWEAMRRRADTWTRASYGGWLDEWLYWHIPRGLLIEAYIGEAERLPIDYKFFVFGGRVEFIQVHLGRGDRHRWIVFDREWNRVSDASDDPDPPRPRSYTAMIEAAEILAADFSFVRVDLYDTASGPKFGEMTFYPGSGLLEVSPASLDLRMGALWREAMQAKRQRTKMLTPTGVLLPAAV